MTAATPTASTTDPEITRLDALTKTPHAAVFDTHTPRTIRLTLDAGQQMPPHRHPDTNLVLHLLTGELDLALDDETYALAPGDLIQFSGEHEISPYAIEDSVAVIVFAPRTG